MNRLPRQFINLILLLTFVPAVVFCKAGKAGIEDKVHVFNVLLTDEMKPEDFAEINKYQVVKVNRVSRSQNLWTVHLKSEKSGEDIINEFRALKNILSVEIAPQPGEPVNSTNSAKGKSKPVKNE